jgi:hypothetical protein
MSRERRFVVPITLTVHGIQNTNIVYDRPEMRKQVTDPSSTLTVLLESPTWLNQKPFEFATFVKPS